jgi:hypothetical protein
MNQEKFLRFSRAYETGLREAVTANPEDYVTNGETPKKFAKALGIKHTRKAVLAYLEIEP